jgi:hypothetical protein
MAAHAALVALTSIIDFNAKWFLEHLTLSRSIFT